MSDRPNSLLLLDILEALNKITTYVDNIDFQEFNINTMIRDAVERNIEIIGEASNKISDDFKTTYAEIEWHKPIAMRNRLIHGYFSIDIPMLWNTVKVVLPPFKLSIEKIISQIN